MVDTLEVVVCNEAGEEIEREPIVLSKGWSSKPMLEAGYYDLYIVPKGTPAAEHLRLMHRYAECGQHYAMRFSVS